MNCQQCGREAEPESKFCVACGSPLELRCPACQTPYDLGSRFCALCGRVLPEIIPSGLSETQSPQKLPEQTHNQDQFEPVIQSAHHTFPCPRCHQKNALDADYCLACGMPLESDTVSVPVVSPSSVPGAEEMAGFWVRLTAFAIDNLLAVFSSGLAFTLLSGIDESIAMGLAFLIFLGYFPALVAKRSTTIGKSFFGLYVVRTDGSRVGIVRAIFRSVVIFLEIVIAWGTFLGIFLLLYFYRKNKRTLHDAWCDTIVVKRSQHLI